MPRINKLIGQLKVASTMVTDTAGKVLSAALNTVGVAQGGTGATSLTDHGVLVGSGTDAVTALAVGGAGTILAGSAGADPVFSASVSGLTALSSTSLTATGLMAAGTITGKRVVEAQATDHAIVAADSGTIFTNTGAGGTVTLTLPASAVGMEFYFYVLVAQALRIDPAGSETIGLPSTGVQQAGGAYIGADAVGEYVHVFCAKAGQWETLDYRGTWTQEGG